MAQWLCTGNAYPGQRQVACKSYPWVPVHPGATGTSFLGYNLFVLAWNKNSKMKLIYTIDIQIYMNIFRLISG
jgi:hypothetical protein